MAQPIALRSESGLLRNFVVRWNVGSSTKLPLPDAPETYPKPGKAKVQFLRSAPASMRQREYKAAKDAFTSPPQGVDNGIHQAMLRLIHNAAHFIYIESQFFVSDFGQIQGPQSLSPAGEFIKDGPKRISDLKLSLLRRGDDTEGPALDKTPRNRVCQALIERIRQAIMDAKKPDFHVYLTLPVHPEGALIDPTVAVQVYWTMQTLANGSHSLLNGIRRALKARELRDKKKPYDRVITDPNNREYEGGFKSPVQHPRVSELRLRVDELSFCPALNPGATGYCPPGGRGTTMKLPPSSACPP